MNVLFCRLHHYCLALVAGLFALTSAAASQPAQDAAAVSTLVHTYLLEQLTALPGTTRITLDPLKNDRLAACDAITPFLPSGMRIRSRMTVGVRCNAPKAWAIYVQATVSVQGQYLVAARPIAMGQAISAEDLTTREGDLVTLPASAMTTSQAVVGMLASQRIAAGQIIKSNALRNPRAVSRGQTVRITARGNGFVVNSEGQALDNAPPGGAVQVRTASGQVVSGIVQNAGVVEIQL